MSTLFCACGQRGSGDVRKGVDTRISLELSQELQSRVRKQNHELYVTGAASAWFQLELEFRSRADLESTGNIQCLFVLDSGRRFIVSDTKRYREVSEKDKSVTDFFDGMPMGSSFYSRKSTPDTVGNENTSGYFLKITNHSYNHLKHAFCKAVR